MGIPAAILGGSLLGGLLSSSAQKSAAKSQSNAATAASQAQLEAAHIAAGATRDAAAQAASATIEAARLNGLSIEKAIEAQERALAQARKANKPYTVAGKEALGRLTEMIKAGPGEFTKDPGYDFRLEQGNDNILANAAATGSLASGRTMKALQSYGQNYASNEYQNFINRYYQSLEPDYALTRIGQAAANNQAANEMSAGSNIATLYQRQGATDAAAQGGLANIYSGLGTALSGIAMNRGEIVGQNFMNQGDIAARSSLGQANAWTGAIQNGLNAYGMWKGNQQPAQAPFNNYSAIPSFGSTNWWNSGSGLYNYT